jgi:hypothetical protein
MQKEQKDDVVECESMDCINYDDTDVIMRLRSAIAVLKRKTEENKQNDRKEEVIQIL